MKLTFLLQPNNVDVMIANLTRKRGQMASAPRRQCLLHPGPRGEAGILGKVPNYISTHAHTHTHTYTHTHIYTHAYIHTYIHTVNDLLNVQGGLFNFCTKREGGV